MPESTQHTLDRVRKPRVHITYDVETEGGVEIKDLPFIVGVLSDLSGKPAEALPPLSKRKFVEIDRDNFNEVLAKISPRLPIQVDDKVTGEEGKQLNVELNFKDMGGFQPENVVKQVPVLRELLDTRDKLNNLLNRMEGNDTLAGQLDDLLKSTELRERLGKSLGVEAPGGGKPGGEEPQS